MYKFIGLAMMGVFAVMVIPGMSVDQSEQHMLYGMATMIKSDSLGNEVFQQSIHNDLTDQGEAFILSAIFDDGSAGPATTAGFGAICVSDQTAVEGDGTIENDTASSFDSPNGLNDASNLTCEEDPDAISISASVATIGPVTFESGVGGTTNIDVGETINSLGICQMDEDVTAHEGFLDCETGSTGTGQLLAVVSVTATTLGSGETVDVTYTFDLSSGTS